MPKWTLAALLLAPLMAFGAADDPAKDDRDELQGTWVDVKGYKANGEELSAEAIKEADHRMTISGDQMTNTSAGRSRSFKIAIDSSKSPKEIDWTIREGTPPKPGIYRVKDDTLEIAWAAGFKDARPTELTPCPKDSDKKWTFGVYRREKKAP
jgi:uncharacterized protein (TIGR03067 family)